MTKTATTVKSPARPRRAAVEKQEPVDIGVLKSPRKSTTNPAKKVVKTPPEKTSAKKAITKRITPVAALSVDSKDLSAVERENAGLLLTNKELQQQVVDLQAQVQELRATIKSMKQGKTSGVVKGFANLSSPRKQVSSKSPQKGNAAASVSPTSIKIITSDVATTEFLSVIPWKKVLKEHYANSAMMRPKLKFEFRDAMQSFIEDSLGRKTEIRCRFIDDAGHVDVGIPENLIEKFFEHFNKKTNAPKQTREEELQATMRSNSLLPKRRLSSTASQNSPARKKNVKLVV